MPIASKATYSKLIYKFKDFERLQSCNQRLYKEIQNNFGYSRISKKKIHVLYVSKNRSRTFFALSKSKKNSCLFYDCFKFLRFLNNFSIKILDSVKIFKKQKCSIFFIFVLKKSKNYKLIIQTCFCWKISIEFQNYMDKLLNN